MNQSLSESTDGGKARKKQQKKKKGSASKAGTGEGRYDKILTESNGEN